MIADKYNVAHRHAHIMKALSSLAAEGEDVRVLLDIAVKNGLSSLRFHGCSTEDARSLLVDAIHFELNTTTTTDPHCRSTLSTALDLLAR